MRRALYSYRFRPFAKVNQPSLGAPFAVSPATYTRHRCAAPSAAQPCPLHALPLLCRFQHTQSSEAPSNTEIPPEKPVARHLPLQCTGCGAFTQTTDPAQAGYVNLERKAVQEYLGLLEPKAPRVEEIPEDKVVEEALDNLSPEQLEALGLSKENLIGDRGAKKPQEEGMLISQAYLRPSPPYSR